MNRPWRTYGIATALLLALTACSGGNQDSQDPSADEEPSESVPGGSTTADLGEYPEREFTVYIPVDPGGTIDSSTRLVTEAWDAGVPFVALNQPGGATEVAALAALEADNEGYAMYSTTLDLHAMMAGLLSDNVDPEDFAPLGGTMALEPALLVNKDTPWQTAEEFISALQEPESDITIAVVQGNALHIQALLMLEALDSDATVVPFASGGDARTSVAGGHTDATIIPTAGYSGLAEDTRILAVFGDENPAPDITDDAPAWSDVSDVELPAIKQVLGWYVSREFADAYPERYQFLIDGFAEAVQSEAFAEGMEGINQTAWVQYSSPEEIAEVEAQMLEFVDQYGSLLTEAQ